MATSPSHVTLAAAATDVACNKEDAAEVLRLVLGEAVVAALHEGCLGGGDFTRVVPLLVGPGAKPWLAAAVRAALATACDTGRAGAAALLLAADGVTPEDANVASVYHRKYFSHHNAAHVADEGYSLLSAAARRGDVEVVRALIASGKASVNGEEKRAGNEGEDKDEDEDEDEDATRLVRWRVPLMEAAASGSVACVEALLADPGIEVNHVEGDTDYGAECDLTEADRQADVTCLRALLKVGRIDAPSFGSDGKSVLMWAVEHGPLHAAREALVAACDGGNAGADALLLAADGITPEDADGTRAHFDEGHSLLSAAVERGHAGVVRALIASGKAKVNGGFSWSRHHDNDFRVPLVEAAANGRTACVEALLAAPGIVVDQAGGPEYGDTRAIAIAAGHGHVACLRALLCVDGINVNGCDSEESVAPLAQAADNGHTACLVALLADRGVDVNQENCDWEDEGYTALHKAADGNHAGCVAALLADDDVNVNHADLYDLTAVHNAAKSRFSECLRAFVAAKGVDLRCYDATDGWTALHHACGNERAEQAEQAEMVSLLLVAGSCRFALEAEPRQTRRPPLALAGDGKEGKAVRAVFLSGVDYWQRKLHGGHSWAMKQMLRVLMLIRQRLDAAPATTAAVPATAARALVHLPEEIWLLMCGFLRSADFPPL